MGGLGGWVELLLVACTLLSLTSLAAAGLALRGLIRGGRRVCADFAVSDGLGLARWNSLRACSAPLKQPPQVSYEAR